MQAGIAHVLDAALDQRPDELAVIARSARLTYRQLDEQAAKAAGALAEMGITAGDRVAASLPNDIDVVVAFHGAMRLGAIWVGINAALTETEKAALLADCAPRVFLEDPQPWRRLVEQAPAAPSCDIDVHAPAGIAYTSGTTGTPKGVVHSQHNLLLPGAVLVAERGYGPDLRKGDCLPLTILNLQVLTSLLTAQAQGTCVVMDRRDAQGIADWIRGEDINVWNGVPTQLFDLCRNEAIERGDLASLREVWSGGGDCPDSLRQEFEDRYGLSLRATYGLTEAPTIVSIDPVGTQRRAGASGKVLGHLHVEAVDGEITVSAQGEGPWADAWTPMLGTWEATGVRPHHEAVLRTGDLGDIEDDWLSIRDRKKLLIVSGGANIYPAEIERVLVADSRVEGAAIVGLPDERLGEVAVGVVQSTQISSDELTRLCSESLARYKVPVRWKIVSELPRNAMGKVVRTGLVELFQ